MSSDDTVLSVKNISKRFEIYDKPRHRLQQMLFGRWKTYFREFWALRDISFEVGRGECIGIVGRNGAGKSTLLQIITGTLQPTSGTVEKRGRVAALLELGSGFNPEFTGRENVYMNATILGLTKEAIDAKYQSIADFADIGDFIDQPVKTYSSGMFVRLAFAVQAMVEPDILIVDEALSVGDLAFQNKCLKCISQLQESGTSIIFVSHDLSTLQRFCNRAVWLNNHTIQMIGNPVSVCTEYQISLTGGDRPSILPQASSTSSAEAKEEASSDPERKIMQHNTGYADLITLKMNKTTFSLREQVEIEYEFVTLADIGPYSLALSIYDAAQTWLIGQCSVDEKVYPPLKAGARISGKIVIPDIMLAPGDFSLFFGVHSQDMRQYYLLSQTPLFFKIRWNSQMWGKMHIPIKWG